MIRLAVVTLACFGLLAYAGFTALSPPADAQDNTEGRLGNVETLVADQGTEVAGLRRRVKRLEGVVLTPRAGAGASTTERAENAGGSGEAPAASGTGTAVSEKFELAAGRYRVTATVEVADFSGFICQMYGPAGFEELLFNELIDSPGTWTGSTVVEIPTAGEFFVEVSNTAAPWRLTFETF